jgi:S1-C subfamily serine protease
MRIRDAIAVGLISATTIVVFQWAGAGFGARRLVANGPGAVRGRAVVAGDAFPVLPAGSGAAAGAGMPVGYDDFMGTGPVDFVGAARMVIPATVHIVAIGEQGEYVSGSGAIISDEGYIVTNNHVIDGAKTIRITLSNRKTLPATVVGADAHTDVAVLKVDGAGLPFLLYGNSTDVKVGQWVLAVGYPLSLQVTATAGIVSGIGRNLGTSFGPHGGTSRGALTDNADPAVRIDSFIQTDAAVNMGNSGGPLVNPAGRIIGINTAMATPNGAYTGYSFAIPVNIVRRVASELIAHGSVPQP